MNSILKAFMPQVYSVDSFIYVLIYFQFIQVNEPPS